MQQNRIEGAITSMVSITGGILTKFGYKNAAINIMTVPTIPVAKKMRFATRWITRISRNRPSARLSDTRRDTATGKPAVETV